MADWPWESANAVSSSQQASPMQSSSLQSSSSQSSHEATQRTSQESTQPPATGVRASSSRNSLVATLETCLTSLPPSPTRRSQSDPSGAVPPALQQSRSGGALSQSTSRALGPARPAKRRSRASRRVPTTVLEATSGDFRDMVQRLTGAPAATASPVPVRPQPQRAAPSTFIRPDRLLTSASVIRPTHNSAATNFLPPQSHLASNVIVSIDDILHPLRRSSSELLTPLLSSNIKRELEAGSSVVTMSESIVTTRPLSAPTSTSWWDSPTQQQPRQINMSNVSSSSAFVTEIIGPSAGHITFPEDNEFSMSQFDAWLSGQDGH